MAKRVQSPSSIKTYSTCPRKYYYHYVAKMPSADTIHTIRGNVAHSVLEDFFDTPIDSIDTINHAQQIFQSTIQSLLVKHWQEAKERFDTLNMPEEELIQYFDETMMMVFNWLNNFMTKLKTIQKPFAEAFATLTPIREKQYMSKKHQVRGFIDAIEHIDGTIRIMDYKTNKSMDINHHRLQLGIYALMYLEEHGRMPDFTGIYFLRGGEETLPVDLELIEEAKKKIIYTHSKTGSEEKSDYPLKISRLCNWGRGQCDYYEMCFKGQTEDEFVQLRNASPEPAKVSNTN